MSNFSAHIIRRPIVQIVLQQTPMNWAAAADDFNDLAGSLIRRAPGWELDFDSALGRPGSADEELIDTVTEVLRNGYEDTGDDDVHYRVYVDHQTDALTTVCVQWFDYYDYDASRFIGEHRFARKEDAEAAVTLLETLFGGRP